MNKVTRNEKRMLDIIVDAISDGATVREADTKAAKALRVSVYRIGKMQDDVVARFGFPSMTEMLWWWAAH